MQESNTLSLFCRKMNGHELVGLYKFGIKIDNIRIRFCCFIMRVVGALHQLINHVGKEKGKWSLRGGSMILGNR